MTVLFLDFSWEIASLRGLDENAEYFGHFCRLNETDVSFGALPPSKTIGRKPNESAMNSVDAVAAGPISNLGSSVYVARSPFPLATRTGRATRV